MGQDPERRRLCMWLLGSISSTHINDINGSGTNVGRGALLGAPRQEYGDGATLAECTCGHTGIKHAQDFKTCPVYTPPKHSVKAVGEIAVSHLNMSDPAAELDSVTHTAVWSLSGARYWLLMTRADMAPSMGYMQRVAHKPLNKHDNMINTVLRYCKRVSTGILFRYL